MTAVLGASVETALPLRRCQFAFDGAHDFDAHTIDAIVVQVHCRRCGLILPSELDPDGSASFVVHTYKGEGLTACGLEVVGPCPDCETRK